MMLLAAVVAAALTGSTAASAPARKPHIFIMVADGTAFDR